MMLPTYSTSGIFFFLLASIPTWAFITNRDKIPNGHRVQHPCDASEIWPGVGHLDPQGGGARNQFGIDFLTRGNSQWTIELCLMDSDGDGFTNGEELGDPDCLWSEGETPERTTDITHPGVCNPILNEICAGRSTFVTCDERVEPEMEGVCENLNRTEVFFRDLHIPRTRVPRRETSYMCYTFNNVPADDDYYLIGLEPLIDIEDLVHHMVIYGCPDSAPMTDEPTECMMGSDCSDVIGIWSFGVTGFCLPDNVGFLFGPNGYKKIRFQFHWDNTPLRDNLYDASGMRFYFEPARPGMEAAGVIQMGSTLLHIPPNQTRYVERGGCDGECTAEFWTGSLNLFAGVNNRHYIGVEQTTSLWREDRKILDIANDAQANLENPVYHRFDPPIVLRPGDRVDTTCVYDSSQRRRTTYYGEGTHDEMCFFYAFYYPKENSMTPYCNKMGPLSQCERNAETPIGNCDWAHFIDGVLTLSLPIAQELRYSCIITGQCLPECRQVVDELKRHPCMQDDVILFVSASMQNSLEGVRFLARYSSCADDVCEVSPGDAPDNGHIMSAWSSKGVLLSSMAIVSFVLKVLA